MITKEEVIVTTKWAAVLNHIRANRIEYLMLVAISHLLGLTAKVYGQVEGVCI